MRPNQPSERGPIRNTEVRIEDGHLDHLANHVTANIPQHEPTAPNRSVWSPRGPESLVNETELQDVMNVPNLFSANDK